jgi:hypothetical protein
MADFLLHENATVQCAHTGQAKPSVTNQRVKVGGQKVVTQTGPYNISGCTLPPQSGGPCATATWSSAATRVKAGGMAVLLKNSQATCVPTGASLNIISTQTRVKGT